MGKLNKCGDCIFWDNKSEEILCMHDYNDITISKCTHSLDNGKHHPKVKKHDCPYFDLEAKEKQYCEYCGNKM